MPSPQPDRVTDLILHLGDGNPQVAEELLPLIYDELRVMAGRLFARQPNGQTLQPTALVHEAWLKLAGRHDGWDGRSHFFAVAARAMRQVLADHARARRSARRGGDCERLSLDQVLVAKRQEYDLVDVDNALERLTRANARHGRVVELRLFGGLTVDEIAQILDVTPRTVKLDWRVARAWLQHVLEGQGTR